jgi:RimJ/RimL family protein N-acetyltransferase
VSAEQPLGEEIDWSPAAPPGRPSLRGEHILLRPLDAAGDAEHLYSVSHSDRGDPRIWTYLPYGPYADAAEMRRALEAAEASAEEVFFTLVRLSDEQPLGVAAYLRITPGFGVIEIGHVWSHRSCSARRRRRRRSSCWRGTPSTTSATAGSSGSATR